MEIIPIEPTDDFNELVASAMQFPLKLVSINNPGDYENENILFIATEDVESLYDYILMYVVEDTGTGLPDYSKGRYLTFDSIDIPQGNYLQIYTCKGEDKSTFGPETGTMKEVVYWNLPVPIWQIPHASFELTQRRTSYSAGPAIQ